MKQKIGRKQKIGHSPQKKFAQIKMQKCGKLFDFSNSNRNEEYLDKLLCVSIKMLNTETDGPQCSSPHYSPWLGMETTQMSIDR